MKHLSYYLAIEQVIRTGHWITDQVSLSLKPMGISEPQYNVLKILESNEEVPCTVRQIQDGMVQRSSNVTRIIDKLLSKGLVERKECTSNRRKMDITITKSGRAFLKKLDKEVNDFHSPMISNLSETEARTLASLIRKLKGEK